MNNIPAPDGVENVPTPSGQATPKLDFGFYVTVASIILFINGLLWMVVMATGWAMAGMMHFNLWMDIAGGIIILPILAFVAWKSTMLVISAEVDLRRHPSSDA